MTHKSGDLLSPARASFPPLRQKRPGGEAYAAVVQTRKTKGRKNMKRIVSLFLALAMLAALAGCGTAGTPADSPASSAAASPAAEETAAPAQEADEYGTVVIQNGDRTVTFTEMPTKVLCCNLYAAENMVMLGLGDYVVGKNVHANEAELPMSEIAAEFEHIPEIEKSFENAIGTGAELVIGQISVFSESSWGSYEMFEEMGINCLTITGTLVADETVEDIYTDIRNLGQIFKVEDRAEALIAQIQARIAAVQALVQDVPEAEKPVVFVADSISGNEIYTTSSGLQSNLIELAGGINATKGMADSRWFTTSVETLIATDPDIIIFNDYGTQTIEEKQAFLDNNPALADVKAVKNQNYYVIPLAEVMQDMRAAVACEKFVEWFYPELAVG